MKPLLRFEGQWHIVHTRPYEPPKQTYWVAWKQLKEGKTPEEAYREWFAKERQISSFLYQYKNGS